MFREAVLVDCRYIGMGHPVEVVMIERIAGMGLGIDDCLIPLAVSADYNIRHSSLLSYMFCLEPENIPEK